MLSFRNLLSLRTVRVIEDFMSIINYQCNDLLNKANKENLLDEKNQTKFIENIFKELKILEKVKYLSCCYIKVIAEWLYIKQIKPLYALNDVCIKNVINDSLKEIYNIYSKHNINDYASMGKISENMGLQLADDENFNYLVTIKNLNYFGDLGFKNIKRDYILSNKKDNAVKNRIEQKFDNYKKFMEQVLKQNN